MSRFNGGNQNVLQQWRGGGGSAQAGPRGLRQVHESNRFQEANRASGGRGQAQATYVGRAQSWYGGANNQGTRNGWDSAFQDQFQSSWNRALKTGSAASFFDVTKNPNATGVATWDHETEDGTKVRFGDVYENGVKVGNVYKDHDKDAANLMMSTYLLDNDTAKDIFKSDDRLARLDKEIGDQRRTRNLNFEKTMSATAFEKDVKKRADAIQDGPIDDVAIPAAGGVIGGLAAGAAAGAVAGSWTGPGALVTGGVGAIVGAGAAWLNRDSLSEQAARAYEKTSLAYDQFGIDGGIATGVKEWSGYAGKFISPLSNLTQGSYDAIKGRGGDRVAEFYKVDRKTGKNETPGWVKGTDVVATVGDSLLQFASPLGIAMFTAHMGGTIGGEVGQLAVTGGQTFDDRRGGFDNVFTDEKGNFDFSSAAAGIGKIGIDAVQLGMARGLAGKMNASRVAAGLEPQGAALVSGISSKVPLWAGGTKGLAANEERVREAGFSFTRNTTTGAIEEGSRRATLSILAPSEQLTALTARVKAARLAEKQGGRAVTTDDIYRVAYGMSVGESRIQTALVNGFGEGYEEAAQAILEPHSHGASVKAQEIFESAAYGAAAGAGMSMGTSMRSGTANDKMYAMAAAGYAIDSGGDVLSRREFDSWDAVTKRQRSALSASNYAAAESAYKKVHEELEIGMAAGVAGNAKWRDAIQRKLDSDTARANPRTDGAFVITQIEEAPAVDERGDLLPGSVPAHSVVASADQTRTNLVNHHRGIVGHTKTLQARLAIAEKAVAADPADTTAAAELAKRTQQLELIERIETWIPRLDAQIDLHVDAIDNAQTDAEVDANTEELNQFLRRAFNTELSDFGGQVLDPEDKMAIARAVSMTFVRDPQDSSGSYQVLVPQVSARLSRQRTNNVVEISHAILPAIRGDYDGDKIRQQAHLILDDNEFVSARSGAGFVGAGTAGKEGEPRIHSVNIKAPAYEAYNVQFMAEAFEDPSSVVSSHAEKTLLDIAKAVGTRYQGVIDQATLDDVLESFFAAVHENNPDARNVLIDGLALKAGGRLQDFARNRMSNEWLWLDQLIVSNFQSFQRSYVAHRPALGPAPNVEPAEPVSQESAVKARVEDNAATLGGTLSILAPGGSLFRAFQKLHYTSLGAAVLKAKNEVAATLQEMAELYRAMGTGITREEREQVLAKDEITANVYVQLQRIAADAQRLNPKLGKHEALAVIANTAVVDFDMDENNVPQPATHGKPVSLAQMLLKQAVMQDKRDKALIAEIDTDLQMKWRKLENMTRPGSRDYPDGAEQAFIEVVGAQQLYTLLGEDAGPFGPHLTVEQYLRGYMAADPEERSALVNEQLKSWPGYFGKKTVRDMPYDLDEVIDGDISPYRALVDAITKVGNREISMVREGVDRGRPIGVKAEQSDVVSENFHTIWKNVRAALIEHAGLKPRQVGQLNTDMIAEMFARRPDVARSIFDLIPDAAAAAGFQPDTETGNVKVANWLYEMFTTKTPEHAEMIYWRNLLLTQWNATGLKSVLSEEGNEGEKSRQYSRLSRRMLRVIYRLNPEFTKDNGAALNQFVNKMYTETDPQAFIAWANRQPGIRSNEAPFTLWRDDVAEFDVDKAQGGWTTALEGAELRESIATLKNRSESLVADIRLENRSMKKDQAARQAIKRVIRHDGGNLMVRQDDNTWAREAVAGDPNQQVSREDRALYEQFVRAIEQAGDWYESLGPDAMQLQILGALRGFNPQSHTKGQSAANLIGPAALEARRDATGYITNYERRQASLTAVNLGDIGNHLSEVAKGPGRSMDEYGRQVEWGDPTPEQMIDLLDNEETRPYARAVLFPEVMELGRDGVMRPQLLVGKSLTDLLDGTDFKNMFPKDESLSQAAALRYSSWIDGIARKFNGHYAFQRAVSDIVIARTSGSDHELSENEEARMVAKAMREVSELLQKAGSIMSQGVDPGTDPFAEIKRTLRENLRLRRTAQALGMSVKEADEISDAMIDQFIAAKEQEVAQTVIEMSQLAQTDSANELLYQAQSLAATDDLETFRNRVELLRTDDVAAHTAAMFSLEGLDAQQEAAKKDELIAYFEARQQMLQQSSASKELLTKISAQLLDRSRNRQVALSQKEWEQLSRAIIGVYLDDVASTTAANVSVSPWPDPEHATDQRYYDTTFSYLVDNLLDPKSPLVRAAAEAHKLARKHGDHSVSEKDIARTLERGILDPKRLGAWTGDIPRLSIEANSRLDAAAAEAAIAMAGNSPKRMAAFLGALRRTFRKPLDEMLSTTTLSWFDITNTDMFDEVEVALPVVGAQRMPLAMMNNRFVSEVMMEVVDKDGEVHNVDLLNTDPELGWPWPMEATVRDSGYFTIHLERLEKAVESAARARGASPTAARVQVKFFHPDSQPADVEGEPSWHNNIYFEGTSFKLNADVQESLTSSLWFQNNSISPSAQASALDAAKLGLPALQVIENVPASEVAMLETMWDTDFSAMLRAKTREMFVDLGFGELDPEFYNAVYKDMKIRHFVEGTIDGQAMRMTAEQVIAWQQQNAGNVDAVFPLEDARLWIPSDEVLRSMLGEQGGQGVSRDFGDPVEIDPSRVDVYEGITESMMQRFGQGVGRPVLPLEQTSISARGRQSTMVVNPRPDTVEQSAYDTRIKVLNEKKTSIHTDRSEAQGPAKEKTRWNAKRNMKKAVLRGKSALEAENLTMHWMRMGLGFGPRDPNATKLSVALLRDLTEIKKSDRYSTGWIYREGTAANIAQGEISEVTLSGDNGREAFGLARGDMVVVELDSFGRDTKKAQERLDHMVGQGVNIVLAPGPDQADMRAELSEYLQSKMYEPIIGSKHAFQPSEFGSRYQNQRARESTLLARGPVSARSRVAVLAVKGLPIQESAAWVQPRNERLNAIGVVTNLVPSSAMFGFNVPVEQFTNESQIQATITKLRALDTDVGRAFLRAQAVEGLDGKLQADAIVAWDKDWRRMINRLDETNEILPRAGDTFGKGSMVPLIDNQGRVMVYRHGYKALDRWDLEKRLARQLPASEDAVGVAVYSAQPEPNATTNEGTVVEFKPARGFGLTVELNVPLSVFGDKMQLEWNGMKYVLTPGDIDLLPDHGFFPDWGFDLVTDLDTLLSKDAVGDMVDNHRNAFAFFGIDFLDDVREFFFPGVKTADARRLTRDILDTIAFETDYDPLSVEAADELINSMGFAQLLMEHLPIDALEAKGAGRAWLDRIADPSDTSSQIARGIITYLMTSGAKPEHVLSSGGFNAQGAETSGHVSRLMPRLFTQLFDNAPLGSPLRTEINERLNSQLYNPKQDGTGYRLLQNWTVEITRGKPGTKEAEKNITDAMWLMPEAHSSGDNPVKNGHSFDEAGRQSASPHSMAVAFGAVGAETAYEYDISKTRFFAEANGITRLSGDVIDGGARRMLTKLPKGDKSFETWKAHSPLEAEQLSVNRDAMKEFRHTLTKDAEHGWEDKHLAEYDEAARKIVVRLGLLSEQKDVVDYWVRQRLGRNYGRNEDGTEQPWVTGRAAIEAADDIWWNVNNGYYPVAAAEVAAMHLHDVQMIYAANRNNPAGWKPRTSADVNTKPAETWSDWVSTALGTALTTDESFDPLYLPAVDGFINTYQGALDSLMDMPVTVDMLKQQNLLDLDLNKVFVSVSDAVQRMLADPVNVDTARATVDDVLGGRRVAGKFEGRYPPAAVIAKRQAARRKWRDETGTPQPIEASMRDFRKNYFRFENHSTNTNALVRFLIHLRVGTALINPALYVSMPIEQSVRAALDRVANIVSMSGTTGATAKLQASTTAKVATRQETRREKLLAQLQDELEVAATPEDTERIQTRIAEVEREQSFTQAIGLQHRRTPEEIEGLLTLYPELGRDPRFKKMVYRDLWFRRPRGEGSIGKLEKIAEGYANFGSRLQDPTWGMKANSMARRYLEAVLMHIDHAPLETTVTVQQLIDHLTTDPEFLMKNYPEAHQAGTNAIAQIRSLKATTLSHMVDGMINPMAHSSSTPVNLFGNIVFRIPLLFSTYAANVATTILGLQGLDQMAAMFLHGRNKGPNSIMGRVGAKIRGDNFNPLEDAKIDLSDVLEGGDLARAFIRGGLTHTGLFAFGLMAGGLGLSGEDEEMKRRRRLAEMQGLGMIYDPRAMTMDGDKAHGIENDFRNSDALFLDNIPVLGALFKTDPNDPDSRSIASMHWMLKQFVSPIMGMEKFFETGDFRQVVWGFEDAMGAFPIINTMMWKDTQESLQELMKEAQQEAAKGTPEGDMKAGNWLTTIVGSYERMLFENSFVNAVYVGADEWDRDPYVLPLRDSDGVLQRDIEGNAREQNVSLQTFMDPDTGKLREGYLGRSEDSQFRHMMSENRFTWAAVSAIFTGGTDSDYLRWNMPIKVREIEKEEMTRDRAEALIKAVAAYRAQGQASINSDEIVQQVRNALYASGRASGHFYTDKEVWAEAEKAASFDGKLSRSILETVSAKALATDEAKAIFRGLRKGTLDFDDPELSATYIPYEMREKIQADWAKELTQEGIELGLDKTGAIKRMKRILQGPLSDPSVDGLADILWSDKISMDKSVSYGQRNTTYTMGPDGLPWATGFKRDNIISAMGLPVPLRGVIQPGKGAVGMDQRLNTTDYGNNMNTGLRALVPLDSTRNVPTDVELNKMLQKAIEDAAKKDYTPFEPFKKAAGSGGSGWVDFGGGYGGYGGGWRNFGGGGGGGYGGGGGGGGYFTRMNPLPNNVTPYANNMPFINTSNPVIRRAFVRRERVQSERGRLKQWQ